MTVGRKAETLERNWATELEITVEVLCTMLAAKRPVPDWYPGVNQDLGEPDFVVVSNTTEDGDPVVLNRNRGDGFEVEALGNITFRNDSESIVRLSFHTDSSRQQPAASLFQLPLYDGAPFLELGPGDEGTATTTRSNGSGTTDAVYIDIRLENSEGQWTSFGKRDGPDMGINNP